MVCSTDASAVLVLLRPLAGHLPRRLIDLIECESAFNDPVAVVIAGVALVLATLTALVPVPTGLQILLGLALLGAGAVGLRRWAGRSRERAIPPAARASSAEVIAAFAQG
jgi:NhaP-type Na+/H+ or K+/H+ antiporter